MKKVFALALSSLISITCYGQGQVVFSNLGGGVNAPVFYSDTQHGPGPEFTAQLMLQNLNGSLTPLFPTSTFKGPGLGAQAIADRYWQSKTVDVPGVQPGEFATFVVSFWRTSFGSYDAARSAAFDYGQSAPVTIPVGGGMLPPANLNGLVGTILIIPEPSVIRLGLIAAATFLAYSLVVRARKPLTLDSATVGAHRNRREVCDIAPCGSRWL
jgi:hypothetical protein